MEAALRAVAVENEPNPAKINLELLSNKKEQHNHCGEHFGVFINEQDKEDFIADISATAIEKMDMTSAEQVVFFNN